MRRCFFLVYVYKSISINISIYTVSPWWLMTVYPYISSHCDVLGAPKILQATGWEAQGDLGISWEIHGTFHVGFHVIGNQWGFPRGSDMILILQDKL